MTTTNEPTTRPCDEAPLSDRMQACNFDERAGELPEELRNAAVSEESVGAICEWLETHPPCPRG